MFKKIFKNKSKSKNDGKLTEELVERREEIRVTPVIPVVPVIPKFNLQQ